MMLDVGGGDIAGLGAAPAGRVCGLELGDDLATLKSSVSAKGFKQLLPCKDGKRLLAVPNVKLFRVGIHNAKAGGFFADVDGSRSSHVSGWCELR